MHKRGQLFIVAALIITGALYSLTATMNRVQINPSNNAFYDLSKEIDFESKRVIDFGVIRNKNVTEFLENFSDSYIPVIGQDKVLFVFGNASSLYGIYYLTGGVGSVGINTGAGSTTSISIVLTSSVPQTTANLEIDNDRRNVTVALDGIKYPFTLKAGENFFLVIVQERNEEAYAANED